MGQWEHLFIDGEFMSRARLLSGLTVEQVSMRPRGLPHTIYEELWHITKWQSIVVQCDEPAAAAWIDGGQDFPSEAPGNEGMWEDLVTEFLAGSKTAVELARSPEALMEEVGPGVTLAERLGSLAVHNAYHLGKIVVLRQVIDAWPPPDALRSNIDLLRGELRLPQADLIAATPSTSVRGFHDVTLHASNVAELRDFYAKLGFQQVAGDGRELAVFLVAKNELAIHVSKDRPRATMTLSLLVSDLRLIEQRLRELEIPFEGRKALRPGLVGVALKDPNENTLEFLVKQ